MKSWDQIQYKRFVLLTVVFMLALGCRAEDALAQFRATPTRVARARETSTPTLTPSETPSPTATETFTPEPTETPFPTDTLAPSPTRPPSPTRVPVRPPTATRSPIPSATPIPVTPTPSYYYKISSSDCRNNSQTWIDGFVYENGNTKNGVLVRISQGPDGQPDPNPDYRTGTDLAKPGYYIQNIDVNAPHGGLWYVWVLDPTTKQRLSDINTVRTDSTRFEGTEDSSESCQHATVNFSNTGPIAPTRTRTPSRTPQGTRTATTTGTPATSTPTTTGTPATSTPTPTTTEPP